MCEYTCQCAFVNGCVPVHKCVIACAHTSDYALQRVQSCLAGVQCRTGSLSFPGLWLCWSCLGPGRLLPKVEKVCWRFRGPGLRDPSSPAENPPLPLGLWLGLSAPEGIGCGRGGHTSSARAPATIFLTVLILSSLLLLLSRLFLISLGLCCSPLYALYLFTISFSGSGGSTPSPT